MPPLHKGRPARLRHLVTHHSPSSLVLPLFPRRGPGVLPGRGDACALMQPHSQASADPAGSLEALRALWGCPRQG